MDNARKKTDKLLRGLERRIKDVYANDPSLLRIQKKLDRYMAEVERRTRAEYEAYVEETERDEKRRLKQAYKEAVWSLTNGSRVYKDIMSTYASAMATANQKALDLINAEMPEIYVLNYNQLADVCRAIGVKVNE